MNTENLTDRIEIFVNEQLATGVDYVTVKTISKKLNIAQRDVISNLPSIFEKEPSNNGALGEYRIRLGSPTSPVEESGDEMSDVIGSEVQEENVEVIESIDAELATESAEESALAAEAVAAEDQDPIVICPICGAKVRRSTTTIRGICPLCWRQLVKNTGKSGKELLTLSDEEFQQVFEEEFARRKSQESLKDSRMLTPEEFAARRDELVPVREVFAAAKEAGYGQGRVAQAMGGDKFRHEPLNGMGSVWTPYFVGARKAWYFDKAILSSFDDLKKPPKPVKEKTARTPRTKADGTPQGAVSRTGARGKAMRPVQAEVENAEDMEMPDEFSADAE